MRRLCEVINGDGRRVYRFMDPDRPPPDMLSSLPRPFVISDTMAPTEQVDGKFYTSKSEFRAVGKTLGLIEVGTEKLQPRTRSSADPAFRRKRQEGIKTAIEKVRAGHYERHFFPDGTRRKRAVVDRGDNS